MIEVTKILLKNGITEMMNENEEYFRENIAQTLAFKLNYALSETTSNIQNKLLESKKTTPPSKSLEHFLSFVESFSPGIFTFQDGTNINITEEDMKDLVGLFEQLNPETKIVLVTNLFESANNFQSNINFAKQIKGLIK